MSLRSWHNAQYSCRAAAKQVRQEIRCQHEHQGAQAQNKMFVTWPVGKKENKGPITLQLWYFSASFIWFSFQPTQTEKPLKPASSQDGTTLAGKWWGHTLWLLKRAKNVPNCHVFTLTHRTRLIWSGWCGSPPLKRTSYSLCPVMCCLPRSAPCSPRRWFCWPVRLHEGGAMIGEEHAGLRRKCQHYKGLVTFRMLFVTMYFYNTNGFLYH